MVIVEETTQSLPISKVLLGLGVEHVIEGSYFVIAKFVGEGGRQKYFASGPNIEHVLNKIEKYKTLPNFEGKVYKVKNLKCILITNNGDENVKNWN